MESFSTHVTYYFSFEQKGFFELIRKPEKWGIIGRSEIYVALNNIQVYVYIQKTFDEETD